MRQVNIGHPAFVELSRMYGVASVGIHEIDVFSDTHACIMGKKEWTNRKKRRGSDPDIHDVLDLRMREYMNDQRMIVLGDLPGGIMDAFLDKMVLGAHGAVVVATCWMSMNHWESFFEGKGIPVVAKVLSHQGQLPLVPHHLDPIFAHGLDRTPGKCPGSKALALKLQETFVNQAKLLTG